MKEKKNYPLTKGMKALAKLEILRKAKNDPKFKAVLEQRLKQVKEEREKNLKPRPTPETLEERINR